MGTFITTKTGKAFRNSNLTMRNVSSSYYAVLTATGDDVFKNTSGSTYTSYEIATSLSSSDIYTVKFISRTLMNTPAQDNNFGAFGVGYTTNTLTEDTYTLDGEISTLSITSTPAGSVGAFSLLYTITNNTGADVTINVCYICTKGYGYTDTPQRTTRTTFLTGIYTFDEITIPNGGSVTVNLTNG